VFYFLDYLSQFITTNSENKCKNTVVQLTAEEQLKKLNKGKKKLTCTQYRFFVSIHNQWY